MESRKRKKKFKQKNQAIMATIEINNNLYKLHKDFGT